MTTSNAFLWQSNGKHQTLKAKTLVELGKHESFLEEIIANEPGLLDLELKETGIYGPFKTFRQLKFTTPQGRFIQPDIVFLTASGHIIITEVKLHNNPELKDRRVIAQIVDYAASFSAMDKKDFLGVFRNNNSKANTWEDLINELFPDENETEELAELYIKRFKNGEINLVIACDRAPTGLHELVEGVTNQNALSFDFRVIELVPYVSQDASGFILFFPVPKIETDIIARTAVMVKFQEGTPMPEVTVNVDSSKNIMDAITETKDKRKPKITPVSEALPIIRKNLADLISQKRISQPWCWGSYSIVSELKMEPIGDCHIEIVFIDFNKRLINKGYKSNVYLGIGYRGEYIEEKINKLIKAVNKIEKDNPHINKKNYELHGDRGIIWYIDSNKNPEEEWTPKLVSNIVEKYFRIIADLLPLEAGKRNW